MCSFCNRPGLNTCKSSRCQRHDRELRDSLDQQRADELIAGIASAIFQRCKCEKDWPLNRIARWWYVAKLMICVAMGLHYRGRKSYPDCIEAGCYHEHHGGYGWGASWIRVGQGVTVGWWFDLHHDGDSFM